MSIVTRILNLWAWSEFYPNWIQTPQDILPDAPWLDSSKMTEAAHKIGEEMAAEIIMPSHKQEVLSRKENPSLDELMEPK